MTNKGPIPDALKNLSILDTRDMMNGVDTLRSDLARVTAERDALRAEVEEMRAVVDAGRAIRTTWHKGSTRTREEREHANLDDALRALDALRTRKGGG